MAKLADGSMFIPDPNGGTGATVAFKRLAVSRSFRLTVKDAAARCLQCASMPKKKKLWHFSKKIPAGCSKKIAAAKKAKTLAQCLHEGGAVYALGSEISVV